jgi:hypothetical protein
MCVAMPVYVLLDHRVPLCWNPRETSFSIIEFRLTNGFQWAHLFHKLKIGVMTDYIRVYQTCWPVDIFIVMNSEIWTWEIFYTAFRFCECTLASGHGMAWL